MHVYLFFTLYMLTIGIWCTWHLTALAIYIPPHLTFSYLTTELIAGMSSSDKYMLLQQKAEQARKVEKEKGKKKKKKGKKGKHAAESEEEDDVPTVHSVSTVVDAPEVGLVI